MTSAAAPIRRGDAVFRAEIEPDTVDLFLYSAAAWITHRTHYDQAFAVQEGHQGVLVHGPLQGAWMIERLQDWATARGGRFVGIRYRHLAPIVAGTPLVIRGHVEDARATSAGTRVEVALAIETATGEVCTSGLATLTF